MAKNSETELLPEAMEINQLMQDLLQHIREAIVDIAKVLAKTVHSQVAND